MSSLFVCINHEFLVYNKTFALPDSLDEDFGWIFRKDITYAVVFQFLFCRRDKERILFIDQESIEHKLGVSHALALQAHTLMELEWGHKRNQAFEQEVVRAILTFFWNDPTSTLV